MFDSTLKVQTLPTESSLIKISLSDFVVEKKDGKKRKRNKN